MGQFSKVQLAIDNAHSTTKRALHCNDARQMKYCMQSTV